MAETMEEIPGRGAGQVLERLYVGRKTGMLELRQEDREDRLFLLSGELYLPPNHRLAEVLLNEREGPRGRDDEDRQAAAAAFAQWLTQWNGGRYRFHAGIAKIGSDVRGPLPTAALVMEAAVHGLDDFHLLRRLRGEDRFFIATGAARGGGLPDLDPQEAFLLSRMEGPSSVKELLRQGDQDRHSALRRLCRLLAAGLIRPYDKRDSAEPAAALSPDLLRRFSDRIADSLDREPLDLAPEDHRARLGDLIKRLGELTHFELLEVEVSATPEQVHDAYLKLARVVHPHHAERLGLAGREAAMSLLFERTTEAYLTLSDSERLRRYLLRLGPTLAVGTGSQDSVLRSEEVKEVAARQYRTAKAMADRGEYHFAIELLHQVVRSDPQAPYYKLLADCQRMNPKWTIKAIANYQRAVELDPDDPKIRVALARAYEEAGQAGRSRQQYEAALEQRPDDHAALEGVDRLRSAGRSQGRRENPVIRFLRWLRG